MEQRYYCGAARKGLGERLRSAVCTNMHDRSSATPPTSLRTGTVRVSVSKTRHK